MIRARRCVPVALGVCSLWVAASASVQAQQDERILSWHSDITVNSNGSLEVRETITVRALGNQLQRGIYRDFPTKYRTWFGMRVTVPFDVREVLRDGRPEPFHTEEVSNGVRVYIGESNVYLDPGEYTYTLSYSTDRQLGHFDEYDELYWNVNGNGWDFPIDELRATVRLPRAVDESQLQLDAYVGKKGSKEQAHEASVLAGGDIEFTAMRPLQPREGLTIVIGFPKGLVTPAEASSNLLRDLPENLSGVVALAGLALTGFYYLVVWIRVGKDPMAGQVRYSTQPPSGISPAAARFLTRMGFDNQTFTAALLSAAVKGYVRIEDNGNAFKVLRLREPDKGLAPEEQKLLKKLFPGKGDTITLEQKNHRRIGEARKACSDELGLQFEKTYFVKNGWYFLPGVLISFVVCAVALLLEPLNSDQPVLFLAIWLTGWTLGCFALGIAVWSQWSSVFRGRGGVGQALFLSLFALPFFAAETVVSGILFYSMSPWAVAAIIGLFVLNFVFYQWLKAPTLLGRQALDEIEGFRQYLMGQQQEYYNAAQPSAAALYESYLPYAVALDLEEAWGEQFVNALSTSEDSVDHDRSPSWYRGDLWLKKGPSGFGSALGSSMSSVIAASSTAPGTSSGGGGGGGGGSSGGGGGGGGGGGW
ncbi:MAG: hypothetical protein AMXMBFR4_20650 [Candidatus Hydrogenedentota bacterium]